MSKLKKLPGNLAAVLTFGRPGLVFGSFACALWLMATQRAEGYVLGLSLLILAMLFDWMDGWLIRRINWDSRLRPFADRLMERLVYSIMFPILGAGMIWRLNRLANEGLTEGHQQQLLHALFVVALGVLVLVRNQFAHFLFSFAASKDEELESFELSQLSMALAYPMVVLLYAYAFYLPTSGWESFYRWLDWLDQVPLRVLLVLESAFLLANLVSLTQNLRKYGMVALDDICEDDEILRRRILAVLPNAITLLNAAFGVAAMVFATYGRVREALFILLGSALFDKLDGTVARRLGLTQPLSKQAKPKVTMGALLDDFSDLISFCIAPGVIYYVVMTSMPLSFSGTVSFGLVGLVYTLAGISRLIYFTLDKSPIPGFFKGMPVPAGALLVIGPVEATAMLFKDGSPYYETAAQITTVVILLAAFSMNAFFIRYLHFGRLMGRHPSITWGLLALSLVLVFTPFLGLALLLLAGIYLISPLFTWRIDPATAELESRVKPAPSKKSQSKKS